MVEMPMSISPPCRQEVVFSSNCAIVAIFLLLRAKGWDGTFEEISRNLRMNPDGLVSTDEVRQFLQQRGISTKPVRLDKSTILRLDGPLLLLVPREVGVYHYLLAVARGGKISVFDPPNAPFEANLDSILLTNIQGVAFLPTESHFFGFALVGLGSFFIFLFSRLRI